MRGVRAERSVDQLRELATRYQEGALRITIRATFPLERIADAHRAVESGHGSGKVVVTVGE